MNFFCFILLKRPKAFMWGIIFFCTMDVFFRILGKTSSELICTLLYSVLEPSKNLNTVFDLKNQTKDKFRKKEWNIFGVIYFVSCIFISQKFQVLLILWYKSSHIFARNLNFLSKFLKLHNLESQFCELLRPQAPPVQKIEWNPLNLVTFKQNWS